MRKFSKSEVEAIAQAQYSKYISQFSLANAKRIVTALNKKLKAETNRRKKLT